MVKVEVYSYLGSYENNVCCGNLLLWDFNPRMGCA
jgi:hypothetical protein